jgi:3-deoxy-D-manno-octulosonic-acid transferase
MAAAQGAAWLTPPASSKLSRSLRARRRLLTHWTAQSLDRRDHTRPLVWLHAPSVGEGLQARPVAQALRAARPDLQQAYSFYSPSAEKFSQSIGADLTGYLPFDRAGTMDALLDAIDPQLLVFVKLDVWPVLVERAVARGIPVAMLSATLAEGSGRRGALSQALVRDAYAALAAVGTIDAVNGRRLLELGVREDALQVTGDTRFDQVWGRARGVKRPAPILTTLASTRPTCVAGSTWPSDEAALLPAWRNVHTRQANARLIIAPHEPNEPTVQRITSWAERSALSVTRLTSIEPGSAAADSDVIIVDRVGVLGDLYALASVAYVGGGFHRAGLHSVIEPAAFSVPVVFGPGHQMSREAGLLISDFGGKSVRDAEEMTRVLAGWLSDRAARDAVGLNALQVVKNGLGATDKSVAMINSLL